MIGFSSPAIVDVRVCRVVHVVCHVVVVVKFCCNVLCLLLLLFVKEGCRRIFPFSSFIVDFHMVILFWIHLCCLAFCQGVFSGGVFPLLVLFPLALVDPLYMLLKSGIGD